MRPKDNVRRCTAVRREAMYGTRRMLIFLYLVVVVVVVVVLTLTRIIKSEVT